MSSTILIFYFWPIFGLFSKSCNFSIFWYLPSFIHFCDIHVFSVQFFVPFYVKYSKIGLAKESLIFFATWPKKGERLHPFLDENPDVCATLTARNFWSRICCIGCLSLYSFQFMWALIHEWNSELKESWKKGHWPKAALKVGKDQ